MTAFVTYPTGTILHVAGVSPDWDWLECDGRTLDGTKAKNAALYAVIGTTYGGTGPSAFNLPDLRGRLVSGESATPTGTGLDGPRGSYTGQTEVALDSTTVGRPAHSHTVTDPGHTHTASWTAGGHAHNQLYTVMGGGGVFKATNLTTARTAADGSNFYNTVAASANVTLTAAASGAITLSTEGATPMGTHENRQPCTALTAVIKL